MHGSVEMSPAPLIQPPLTLSLRINTVQCQTQEVGVGTICEAYSDFIGYVHTCVWVCVFGSVQFDHVCSFV